MPPKKKAKKQPAPKKKNQFIVDEATKWKTVLNDDTPIPLFRTTVTTPQPPQPYCVYCGRFINFSDYAYLCRGRHDAAEEAYIYQTLFSLGPCASFPPLRDKDIWGPPAQSTANHLVVDELLRRGMYPLQNSRSSYGDNFTVSREDFSQHVPTSFVEYMQQRGAAMRREIDVMVAMPVGTLAGIAEPHDAHVKSYIEQARDTWQLMHAFAAAIASAVASDPYLRYALLDLTPSSAPADSPSTTDWDERCALLEL